MIYLRSLIYGFVYCDSTTRSLESLFIVMLYHYALILLRKYFCTLQSFMNYDMIIGT